MGIGCYPYYTLTYSTLLRLSTQYWLKQTLDQFWNRKVQFQTYKTASYLTYLNYFNPFQALLFTFFTQSYVHVQCLTLAINEITAINEMTNKIDQVLLTWIALRNCEKELTHTVAENLFRKFQQIHKK